MIETVEVNGIPSPFGELFSSCPDWFFYHSTFKTESNPIKISKKHLLNLLFQPLQAEVDLDVGRRRYARNKIDMSRIVNPEVACFLSAAWSPEQTPQRATKPPSLGLIRCPSSSATRTSKRILISSPGSKVMSKTVKAVRNGLLPPERLLPYLCTCNSDEVATEGKVARFWKSYPLMSFKLNIGIITEWGPWDTVDERDSE